MAKPGPKPKHGKARRTSVYLSETANQAMGRLLARRLATNPKASESDVMRDALVATDTETFVAYQASVTAELQGLRRELEAALARETALERLVADQTDQRDRSSRDALAAALRVWKANPEAQADLAQLLELERTGSVNLASQFRALNRAREILGTWADVHSHLTGGGS